jgi:hypothetical protein
MISVRRAGSGGPSYCADEEPLVFERASHRGGVLRNHCQEHLRGPVGAVRALLPISNRAKREVEPRREFFLRQISFCRNARTLGTRRARAGWARVAGRASGSEAAAR